MVVTNPVATVIGNFFTRLNYTPYKVKLFTNYNEAYQRLLENKDE